ncbi:hypothetical protein ABVT39_010286 [Epinephelus coioides]
MDVDHHESSGETKSAMHTWRYRHHFTYKADQGKNIIVQCNLCLPRVNLLSTSKTSTSNLKKHLDRTHLGCEARPDVKRGRKKEEHNGEESSKESDDDIGFYENVSAVLEGEPEQDMLLFLPTVQRCASHTLELIVTEDFWQAVSQGPMCQLHYSTLAKVYAIWSKCHHLQVGMSAAEEIGKMALVVPAVIRWNVEYCAIQKIVSLTERELTELEEMCSLLATEASQMDPCSVTEANTSRNLSTIESEDDFFSYGSVKPTIQIQQRGVMEEVRKYLEGTGKSLECLQDFPRMKQLFLKYNTTLPSTAPVQRLFSQKGNLVTSQRNFLTDDYFERIQLLRYNSNVCTLVTE